MQLVIGRGSVDTNIFFNR